MRRAESEVRTEQNMRRNEVYVTCRLYRVIEKDGRDLKPL